MTRINRVQRLASLRSSCTVAIQPASPFLTSRSVSTTSDVEASPERQTTTPLRRGLRLPPKTTIADTEAEIAAADPSYTPATTMADLEPIPEIKTWWRQPGNWTSQSDFSGFGVSAREKITDGNLIRVMLKRAVVEIEALQQSGQYDQLKFKKWAVGGKKQFERTMKQGELTKDDILSITKSFQGTDNKPVEADAVPSPEEAEVLVKSWGSEWMSMALNDETKFIIRKRLYQLTGTLLPDAKLAAASTVRDIAALATVAPKPTKLYHALRAASETQPLPPNVKIHGRRITPIDREKSVGRWKLIQSELMKRQLPVTGSGDLASHREKVWLLGKK